MESSTKLYSLLIQEVPKELTLQGIQNIFGEFGEIIDSYIARPRPTVPDEKLWATVQFASKMEAATAIARLDRQPPLYLSVDWTGTQEERDHWKKHDDRGGPQRTRSWDSETSRECGSRLAPLYVPAAMSEPCANCSQEGRLRCSRCKTWYCSVDCQENHWTRHRDRCTAPPPLENPDGSMYNRSKDKALVKVVNTVRDNDSGTTPEELLAKVSQTHKTKQNSHPPRIENEKKELGHTNNIEKEVQTEPIMVDMELKVVDMSTSKMTEATLNVEIANKQDNAEVTYEALAKASNKSSVDEITKKPLKSAKVDIERQIEATEEKHDQVSKSCSLRVGKATPVTVSHAVSPGEFYVVPQSNKELFESILVEIQDQPEGLVEIKTGLTCLAKHEGLWYRSTISKVSPDGKKAKVAFIDFGNNEKIDASDLKPLDIYKEVEGVAVRVKMAGIQPNLGIWTNAEIENFKEIVDEGGETTFFATVIGFNDKGEPLVNLVDDDKTDVGTLCVEVGVGIKIQDTDVIDNKEMMKDDLKSRESVPISSGVTSIQLEKVGGKIERATTKPDQVEEKIDNTKNKDNKDDQKIDKTINKNKVDPKKTEDAQNEIEKGSNLKFGSPTEVLVVRCASPRDMSVLPSSKEALWNDLLINTQDPAPGTVQPEVGNVYLTNNDGLWARALVHKVSPDRSQVKVDLIDFGNLGLKIKVSDLRELTGFKNVEGLVVRVGLAGVGLKQENFGETELEMLKQVVDVGGESKFIVEGLGALDGIEIVAMKDVEGSDIKEMCLELDLGTKLEEFFTPIGKGKGQGKSQIVEEIIEPHNNEKKDILDKMEPHQNAEITQMKKPKENLDIPTEIKPQQGIEILDSHVDSVEKKSQEIEKDSVLERKLEEPRKLPRYRLPTDKPDQVAVCFVESPAKFYVSPVSKSAIFDEILLGCQELPAGKVHPKVGLVCLVFSEECWQRAEVEKVSPDGSKVKVFLLDYGKTIKAGVNDLKPLTKFVDVEGLVCEVGLSGIKPAGSQWSQEEIENFNLVVDVGGETKFMVKAVGVDKDGVVRVDMVDMEDNNILQLSLEMGVGEACNLDFKKIETVSVIGSILIENANNEEKSDQKNVNNADAVNSTQKKEVEVIKCFPRTILPLNVPTEVIVSHADNPSKIFLFPTTQTEKFMEVLEGCQDVPTGLVNPTVGLVCLAFADEAWYRADIVNISPDKEEAKVFLLDYGKTIKVAVKELKPLNKLMEVAGLVAVVGLVNIGCGEEIWSQEALDNLKIVLDVGGDTTFTATNLGQDEDGMDRVKMVDVEGNDISEFCIEMEIGVKVEHKLISCHLEETVKQKEVVTKSTSPRIKPLSPIKAAAPLKAAVPVHISTSVSKVSSKTPPSPVRLPPCADSILTTLVCRSNFQVMKDAKSSLSMFSSICMTEDDESMNYLLDDLQSEAVTFRDAGVVSVTPHMRSWVVAWSSDDQMFYRAVIIGVTPPDTYTALLIDFAMTQQFSKDHLLDIWPEAARRKAMAIQLTAVSRISLEVEKAGNAYFAANTSVDCQVSEKDDEGATATVVIPEIGVEFRVSPWYNCDAAAKSLFQTPALAEKTHQNNYIPKQPRQIPKQGEAECMMKDFKISNLTEGAAVQYCGHGDKMCEVYVKQDMDQEKVASLMTTLNLAMCSRDTREYKEPIIGSIVAVKWSQDEGNMFYRASVTAINQETKKAKLLLVDYGKRIVENWENMTWLPHEARKAPMYAVPVLLKDVTSSSSRQHSQFIQNITRDYRNKSLKLVFISSSTPPTVNLFIDNNNTFNAALQLDGDNVEKEKKKLALAKQLALLQEELANL